MLIRPGLMRMPALKSSNHCRRLASPPFFPRCLLQRAKLRRPCARSGRGITVHLDKKRIAWGAGLGERDMAAASPCAAGPWRAPCRGRLRILGPRAERGACGVARATTVGREGAVSGNGKTPGELLAPIEWDEGRGRASRRGFALRQDTRPHASCTFSWSLHPPIPASVRMSRAQPCRVEPALSERRFVWPRAPAAPAAEAAKEPLLVDASSCSVVEKEERWLPEDYQLAQGEVSAIQRDAPTLPEDVFRCVGCTKAECQGPQVTRRGGACASGVQGRCSMPPPRAVPSLRDPDPFARRAGLRAALPSSGDGIPAPDPHFCGV